MSGTTSSPVTDYTTNTRGVAGTEPECHGGTKTVTGCSTHQSYAKGGCTASVVLQKLQWKLPEGVERTSLNALHDVEDRGGLHRKQN